MGEDILQKARSFGMTMAPRNLHGSHTSREEITK